MSEHTQGLSGPPSEFSNKHAVASDVIGEDGDCSDLAEVLHVVDALEQVFGDAFAGEVLECHLHLEYIIPQPSAVSRDLLH